MKHSNVLLLFSLLLTVNASGQEQKGKQLDITLLNAGTPTWPLKLTRGSFEGDTIYFFTFRDTGYNITGKTGSQGFYKFELKEFGKALNTTLTIDSTQEVTFWLGTMNVSKGTLGMRYLKCKFSSGTGTFRAREVDVKKLVTVINKQ